MDTAPSYIVRLKTYCNPLTLDTAESTSPPFVTRSEAEAYAIRLSQRGHVYSWSIEEAAINAK